MTTVSVGGGGITRAQAGALLIPAGTLRSGLRLMLPIYSTPLKTTAIAADTMYAYPILAPVNALISGVAVQVGTAVPGVSAKLGLALPGADGLSATLLAEAPTPVDMNSATDTELVATFSAPVNVPQGFMWGLFVANGVAQPFTVGVFNYNNAALAQALGGTGMSQYTLQGTTGATIRVSRAHTYATAFPTSLTGWTRANTNPSSPVMAAVVA
jgi:hypothetical protein